MEMMSVMAIPRNMKVTQFWNRAGGSPLIPTEIFGRSNARGTGQECSSKARRSDPQPARSAIKCNPCLEEWPASAERPRAFGPALWAAMADTARQSFVRCRKPHARHRSGVFALLQYIRPKVTIFGAYSLLFQGVPGMFRFLIVMILLPLSAWAQQNSPAQMTPPAAEIAAVPALVTAAEIQASKDEVLALVEAKYAARLDAMAMDRASFDTLRSTSPATKKSPAARRAFSQSSQPRSAAGKD
ncbi:MAG TPA: hypothetical protein PLI13_18450, partial [Paracoccus sp. (in: a-proteobacteria)]|nr:hypothetical protein [Paracoccus sp. (in: a-proteobacteria)]